MGMHPRSGSPTIGTACDFSSRLPLDTSLTSIGRSLCLPPASLVRPQLHAFART
jgi:hypothetical protein